MSEGSLFVAGFCWCSCVECSCGAKKVLVLALDIVAAAGAAAAGAASVCDLVVSATVLEPTTPVLVEAEVVDWA